MSRHRNHPGNGTPGAVPQGTTVPPRNTVFLALKRRVLGGGGDGRHRNTARMRDDAKDLADRIREVGEW